jgi:methylmalonic acid semialdehyde dehydrogenase
MLNPPFTPSTPAPTVLTNFYNNEPHVCDSGRTLEVTTPHTGAVITTVPLSTEQDVDKAVQAAAAAFPGWSTRTFKDRAQFSLRFSNLLNAHLDELAELIVYEHGKTIAEAIAEIKKGLETLEYAVSLPQLAAGNVMDVSRGVRCEDRRDALGVVASVVPFNFPMMVPFWTIPIALGCGNTMVLKPSEKVPLTMSRVAELAATVFPKGVFNLVHGDKVAASALAKHPLVRAFTFVGTTAVARHLSHVCRQQDKRCIALGGAKNYLVAAPDCNVEMTSQDVVNSFTGCSGQRCMAASVLVVIGEQPELIKSILSKASKLTAGSGMRQVGPVIDSVSRDRILDFIIEAESSGDAKIVLDGRSWAGQDGFWVGPTILHHNNNRKARALHEEIFGPVLSILHVKDAHEAIALENAVAYGNAACIYTQSGATAEWFTKRFSAAMMGVNIGVPVPREPFSFGGMGTSKFGDHDITGDGGLEFFTMRKKVTTKWSIPTEQSWLS